jgi:hypothetical protein
MCKPLHGFVHFSATFVGYHKSFRLMKKEDGEGAAAAHSGRSLLAALF